jgi:cobaltochelatase CobT
MKNKTLNNAFPIVAAALGNKFGVNVSVGGSDAYTTGKMINIPAYNLEDPSYKDVAWGYLAHEAAHVRFTDFTAFSNAATNPVRKRIVNILEDIRIEKLMQNAYPGTKRTTEKVVQHLIQTGGFQITGQNEQVHPAAVLSQFLLFRLRNDILGQTALLSYADTAESLLEDTFPVGAVTRLNGLLSEVPQFQFTRDCVRLADRILRMIEEEQEKEQEKALQKQQSQQQDSDDSSSQSQPEQTDQDEDSTDTDSSDSPQDSSSQDDDSPSDQDADEPAQQPGDSEPDNDDQVQSSVSQPTDADDQDPGDLDTDSQPGQSNVNDSGSNDDNSQDEDSEQLAQNLASVLSAGDDDVPDDVFDIAKDLLGSQPVNSYDENVHMPVAMDPVLNPAVGNALMNKVLGNSGKIRASLQGLVQSSRRDRPVHKRSGNRIDGRKLSRLSTGDSRVFERRSHKEAPNTAIDLLVDGSTSMGDNAPGCAVSLMNLAIESAIALALALEGISGVNPAVTRFPHSKTGNVVPLLKHGEKVRINAPKFSPVTSGTTPLHEALWYAALSVMSTREERKVIMVLTDGQPDDTEAAKAIIKRIEATGIELFGIGICFDTSHLFSRSILINDVSELRSELFRISHDLLLAA